MDYFEEACQWIHDDVEKNKGEDCYITIESESRKSITVFDAMEGEEDSRFYTIHNPEYMTKDYFKSIIRVSDDAKHLSFKINTDALTDYLANKTEKPVFSTIQRIVFCTGDEEDTDSLFKDNLIADSVFEGAHDLPYDKLGLRWWENDVVLINIQEIINTTKEIEEDYKQDGMIYTESNFTFDVNSGIVTTLLHEARHCAQENPYLSEERFNRISYDSEVDAEEYARDWYDKHPVYILQEAKVIEVENKDKNSKGLLRDI